MSDNKVMGFSDKGPWGVADLTGRTIESDDFTHDVWLEINGDFGSNKERHAYAQGLADLLNKHNGSEHAEGQSSAGEAGATLSVGLGAACSACKFAGEGEGYDNYTCRRNAPLAVHDPNKHCGVYQDAFVPRWPLMRSDDWCGEFKAPNVI